MQHLTIYLVPLKAMTKQRVKDFPSLHQNVALCDMQLDWNIHNFES